MKKRSLVLLFAALGFGLMASSATNAQTNDDPVEEEKHCIVVLSDSLTNQERCYATEAAVDAALGTDRPGTEVTNPRETRSWGSTTIGRHYTSTSYSGSSVTIVGTTCAGGVWYPSGSWNNNIESSRNYCGSSGTTFYNSSSCSGSSYKITSSRSSLGWMNNKASCVRYG